MSIGLAYNEENDEKYRRFETMEAWVSRLEREVEKEQKAGVSDETREYLQRAKESNTAFREEYKNDDMAQERFNDVENRLKSLEQITQAKRKIFR